MISIGITGQSGFIGMNLFNTIGLFPKLYKQVPFNDEYFRDEKQLRSFVKECDVIVHLAAQMRSQKTQEVYNTNVLLTMQLISAMEIENVCPRVFFTSSIQETLDNEYGLSKKKCVELLSDWAKKHNANFMTFVLPNVFGVFAKPNYSSFIATFCHKLTRNEEPQILIDADVKLIYIDTLVHRILACIDSMYIQSKGMIELCPIAFEFEWKVSRVLALLTAFKKQYIDQGIIPFFKDANEVNLFNTFRSYIDIERFYPRKMPLLEKDCFSFEIANIPGKAWIFLLPSQKGIGGIYLIRTIERILIIKGEVLVELRITGTNNMFFIKLNNEDRDYIDVPIWCTYDITNIGCGEASVLFWRSKFCQEAYLENV